MKNVKMLLLVTICLIFIEGIEYSVLQRIITTKYCMDTFIHRLRDTKEGVRAKYRAGGN